ncbi:MAG: EAL domain-containing protein [Candidatus Thiodiazotropha sp. (ex Lucina pensylvanica)]|nr:EAL domain-containing protein [Candidatus Thiodiazotropha sp. (ex Lucina pensylvanica)]
MRTRRIGHLSASFIIVISISLGIVGYLVMTGEQMVSRHTPQIDAAMEIKVNATLAHLWFEEIISGDRYEQIDDVWSYLDESDWYARALLEGGTNEEGTFVPLSSADMRRQIESVRVSLSKFRTIAEQRFSNYEASLPGSGIDQEFDQIFAGFIDQADQVETLLQESIALELSKFKQTAVFLTTILAATGVVLAIILYRLEMQREQHLHKIEQTSKKIEAQNTKLDYLAYFDTVSGLPNRSLFTDRLDQAVGHARRKLNCVAVLFIDLDRFKNVNDRLGHARGDEILKLTAKRLKQCLRSDDTVARIGGDEFTVILADLDDHKKAATAAGSVAEHISLELAKPFDIGGLKVDLSASIGIAIYPIDANEGDALLINSDHAMYEAKQNNRGSFCFFSREIENRVTQELQIGHDLHNALKDNQFTVHYQPQYELQNDSIVGFEALVRWDHPKQWLLAPVSFMRVAEDTGLIEEIDLYVLNSVCRQQQEWQQQGLPAGKIAVNFSAALFSRKDIAKIIASHLAEYCISNQELEIEITESAMLKDMDHTQQLFEKLTNIGISIAIDDFGTGYSSMSYLQNFSATVLKIDRSFVHDIDKSRSTQAIMLSMLELARNLNMEVVAEGVETPQEKAFIKSTGCRFGQGYLLGKPMTAQQAYALLLSEQENNVSVLSPRKV